MLGWYHNTGTTTYLHPSFLASFLSSFLHSYHPFFLPPYFPFFFPPRPSSNDGYYPTFQVKSSRTSWRRKLSPSTGGKGRRRTYSLCWVCYEDAGFITGQKSKEAGSRSFAATCRRRQIQYPKCCGCLARDDGQCPKYQSCLLPS